MRCCLGHPRQCHKKRTVAKGDYGGLAPTLYGVLGFRLPRSADTENWGVG